MVDEQPLNEQDSYRHLIDGLPVGLYRTAPDGRILDANAALVQILGYPNRPALLSVNAAAAYMHEADRRRWQELMERHGIVRDFEAQICRYDGRIIWIKDSSRAVHDEQGRLSYYDGILEDITERKKAEEALQRRDAILEALAYSSQQLLLPANLDAVFTAVLADVGSAVDVSRAYIFENYQAADGVLFTTQRCEWSVSPELSQLDDPNLQDIPYIESGFERWLEILGSGQPLHGLVSALPPAERRHLTAQNIISMAVVPIHSGGKWWGFLGFDDCQKARVWSTVEIAALKNTAGVLGTMVENDQLYKSERWARERAEVMQEVAQIVSASLDRDEILQRSLSQLRRVLTFDTASVYIFSQETSPEFAGTTGFANEDLTIRQGIHLLKSSPILARMKQDFQPVISPDVRHLSGWIWVPGAEHVRSFIAVPLMSRQQVIGALMVDNKKVNFFDRTDLQMTQALAQHVAVAVENARLFETAQRTVLEQTALLAASTAVSSSLDLKTVLSRLAVQMGEAIDVTSVYISDWNRQKGISTVLADYYSSEATPAERVSDLGVTYNLLEDFGDDLSWWEAEQTWVLHVDDPGISERERRHIQQYEGKSILNVPLVVKDTIVGYAELWESRRHRSFNEREIALAKAIAQQAAIAFENAGLFESQRTQLRLAKTLQEVGALMTTQLNLDEVFEQIFDLLAEVVQYDSVSMQLIDGDRTYMAAGRGFPDSKVSEEIISQITTPALAERWGREHQRVMVISDTHADDRWDQSLGNAYIRSWIGSALWVKGRLLGTLNVDSATVNAYDTSIGETVVAFANQAAVAVENARLFAAERRQLHLAQTMQQVGALLTTRLSLDEVFELIFDLLAQVVEYDTVSVQLVGEDGRTYLGAGRGFPDVDLLRQFIARMGEQATHEAKSSLETVVISDTWNDSRWVPEPDFEYIRSWVGAPLLVKGRSIGVLNVDSATVNAYDLAAGETVAAFANQAAVAIENARLYEETRQRANELAILHQVALATAAVVNVDDLIQQTTELIAASLYTDSFGFVLIDDATGQLMPHSSYHGAPPDSLDKVIPFDASVTGQVARTGRSRLIRDVNKEPLYYRVISSTCSEVAVPLTLKQRVIGVINVESPIANAFSESDIRFLTTLAGQVAIAFERAQLYESLQQYTAHLAQEVNRRTAELRAERDRNQAVLDSAGEGIFFTDYNGVILYVNPAITRLTGYTVVETLGQTPLLWHTLQKAPNIVDPHAQMWEAIHAGRGWSGELVNRRKDGVTYDANLTIAPIYDAVGELTGFVGIQSDISRLKEVDRLKSKFVSNVSHELRTPLTNIKTYITLLERGKPERHAHYLNVLQHETERLTGLIQDLLDLSRLDTEAVPIHLQPTDFREIATGLLDTFMAKAESKQIELTLDVMPDLPPIMAEPFRLEQVLTNLLGNALAYTSENGRVAISTGVEEVEGQAFVWLRVSDTGPGIAAEDLPRLFERFFRGQLTQDSNVPGTGLGLAICKEIIDRHQGTIEVESVVGEGTTFTVRLIAAV